MAASKPRPCSFGEFQSQSCALLPFLRSLFCTRFLITLLVACSYLDGIPLSNRELYGRQTNSETSHVHRTVCTFLSLLLVCSYAACALRLRCAGTGSVTRSPAPPAAGGGGGGGMLSVGRPLMRGSTATPPMGSNVLTDRTPKVVIDIKSLSGSNTQAPVRSNSLQTGSALLPEQKLDATRASKPRAVISEVQLPPVHAPPSRAAFYVADGSAPNPTAAAAAVPSAPAAAAPAPVAAAPAPAVAGPTPA
jgi:hypothetical protein